MIIIGGLPWNCKSTSTLAFRLEKYLIRTKSGKITGYCVFPACQWFTSRDLRSFQNYDSEITAYPFLRSWEYYTVHLLSIIRCVIDKILRKKSPWTVWKFFFEHFSPSSDTANVFNNDYKVTFHVVYLPTTSWKCPLIPPAAEIELLELYFRVVKATFLHS